jgi:predicted transcriptional regulator of viral defense system
MKGKGRSNREKLRWLAFDHHGIVTIDQAAAVGVPAVELCKLAARARARQPENDQGRRRPGDDAAEVLQ